ncbi:MAG: hypothetical protein H7Y04_12785 [Verrucomicrobia bacterium]|nr:hypothetical protein [Cytophagales bacterium]
MFEEKESFFIIEGQPPDEITAKGKKYENVDDTFVLGFYDWLRTDEGKVVGVRLYPFSDSYFPYLQFKDFERTIVIEDGKIEIYFFNEMYFSEDKSGDQSFSSSKILRSTDSFLLAFDLYYLDEAEIEQLTAGIAE